VTKYFVHQKTFLGCWWHEVGTVAVGTPAVAARSGRTGWTTRSSCPEYVKTFVIALQHTSRLHFDAHWTPECPDVKNYKWRLNTVWHRML